MDLIGFGVPIEAPAKAGVWGWVKPAYAAKGREQWRSDSENGVEKRWDKKVYNRMNESIP